MSINKMEFSEFLRIFEVRAQNLMWFLGAGCSTSAGIPSASDIIWDCKSRIYCSEQAIPRSKVSDINDPKIQSVIQDYLQSKGIYPKDEENDGDEYTYYFSKAMSSEKDRQSYIRELVSKASPSYGHTLLACLTKVGKAPIVWTTNFDKLYENAVYEIYGNTNELIVADLGEPSKAIKALNEKTFPLLVKLHGDFQSDRLKNTTTELRSQDELMREALSKASADHGLCIVGYSGRDKSVMKELTKAALTKGRFPHGIFWFIPAGTTPLENVNKFISTAQNNKIEAQIVEINNFDEGLDNIRRYLAAFPRDLEEKLKPKSPRNTESPINPEAKSPPFLRLNALKVQSIPSMCKLIQCDIGGDKEVKKAIEDTQANVIAKRIKRGVIAFGSDIEIKKAFRGFGIKSIEIYPIDINRLNFSSGEYKLVLEALCLAIGRQTGFKIEKRRGEKYLVANENFPTYTFNKIIDCAVSSLSGTVPSTSVKWQEACKIDLDYKFGKLWILLTPRTLLSFTENTTEQEKSKAKSFVRERTAPKKQPSTGRFVGYNYIAASILSGWISAISQNVEGGSINLSSFDIDDGLNPQFDVSVDKVVSGRCG